MGRRGELIRQLVLIGVLLFTITGAFAGCVGSQVEPPAAGLREGDELRYSILLTNRSGATHQGDAFIHVGHAGHYIGVAGWNATALPVRVELAHASESYAFLATLSLVDRRLVSIGALGVAEEGSEQYRADSPEWNGDPRGPLNVERCVGGLLLPLAASEGDGDILFGSRVRWSRPDSLLLDDKGASVGSLRVGRPEHGWPETMDWRTADGSCQLVRKGYHPGEAKIVWDTGAAYGGPPYHTAVVKHGVPPTGTLPIDIPLEEAVSAARRSVEGAAFFKEHPAAWLIQAEYRGPKSASPHEEPRTWALLFGDSRDGAQQGFLVKAPAASILVAVPIDFPRRYVPPPIEQPIAEAAEMIGRLTIPNPRADLIVFGWYAADEHHDRGTDDEGAWQVRWQDDKFRNVLFSAVSGRPLARVEARASPLGP